MGNSTYTNADRQKIVQDFICPWSGEFGGGSQALKFLYNQDLALSEKFKDVSQLKTTLENQLFIASKSLKGVQERVLVRQFFIVVIRELVSRFENGDALRNDGFFSQDRDGTSLAEKVTEKAVEICQFESEELKIEYTANFYMHTLFDETMPYRVASARLGTVGLLSYLQLCLIKAYEFKTEFEFRNHSFININSFPNRLCDILEACEYLINHQYIFETRVIVRSSAQIVPSSINLTPFGKELYFQMQLEKLPMSEISDIASILK